MSKRTSSISVLDELAATVSAVLRERGLGAILADSCAREVAGDFAKSIGGRHWYIPHRINPSKAAIKARDAEIRSSFTGTNTTQLARRYRISVRRVQQIVGQASNIVLLRRAG